MVDRPGITYAELAKKYERSIGVIRNTWARHPAWATIPVVGHRGRALEFDEAAADEVIRRHFLRPPVEFEPHRLYTAREIADAAGLTRNTIDADVSRGRWPAPDEVRDGVNLWRGSTAAATLATRRKRTRRGGDEAGAK